VSGAVYGGIISWLIKKSYISCLMLRSSPLFLSLTALKLKHINIIDLRPIRLLCYTELARNQLSLQQKLLVCSEIQFEVPYV
jgi:hypothetical protein